MPVRMEESERFFTETAVLIAVQVPQAQLERVQEAVEEVHTLKYGDYDKVSFATAPGVQRFRALGTGRNAATEAAVTVPCVELRFTAVADAAALTRIVTAIYGVHPYEEPVIHMMPALRMRHVRGMDEDNPMRFWNSPPEDWVPEAHRG